MMLASGRNIKYNESESESDLLHDMTKQLVFQSWDVCAHNNIIN